MTTRIRAGGIAQLTDVQAHALRILTVGGRGLTLSAADVGELWDRHPSPPPFLAEHVPQIAEQLQHAGYIEWAAADQYRATWRGLRKAECLPAPARDNTPPF